MASVSITNQTLTLTIDINGVETVIRKDNCKVVAIGDVVRITDYRGSIYEFLYSDCTAPDEASANDLRDAIEVFLNTAGGGGGSGITSIKSDSLEVSIDDGVATVKGISGTWTPVITNVTGGATVSASGDGIYSRTGNVITCSASIGVALNESESAETTFQISLPITTEFQGGGKLVGSFSGQTRSSQGYFLNQINFDSVNGESKAFVSILTSSDTTEASTWSFQFVIQYIIE